MRFAFDVCFLYVLMKVLLYMSNILPCIHANFEAKFGVCPTFDKFVDQSSNNEELIGLRIFCCLQSKIYVN